ncbi:MAG: acetate--CoA ligase family protein, partial [Mycobacterium sp.]|nr:acetate--CoA ligase family protein [Mycobacterium sp.]
GADTRTLFSSSLKAIVDDPAVAVTALAVDLVSEFDGDTAYPDAVIEVAAGTEAPLSVLASVPSAVDRATAERLRSNGIAVLENARSGIAALGHLASWPLAAETAAALIDLDRQHRWSSRLAGPDWDAHAAFALLADYGIAIAATGVADDLDDVLAVADAVGYPVALKTSAADHKSDVGGVVLGIADTAALSEAYRSMADRLGPAVSVHAMAQAGVEVSVGVVRDANFGPLIVVAAGGTMVELLADRAVACPPVTSADAARMLRSLRIAPLLAGWRGEPPVNTDALAAVIAGFSQLALELGDVIDAVEANPVIASPIGAIAVDALVIARDQKIE